MSHRLDFVAALDGDVVGAAGAAWGDGSGTDGGGGGKGDETGGDGGSHMHGDGRQKQNKKTRKESEGRARDSQRAEESRSGSRGRRLRSRRRRARVLIPRRTHARTSMHMPEPAAIVREVGKTWAEYYRCTPGRGEGDPGGGHADCDSSCEYLFSS